MKTVIGIDPGVRALGLAVMQVTEKKKPVRIMHASVIYAKDGLEWFERIAILLDKTREIIEFVEVDLVACECPQIMGGPRGRASAARGDVVHLAHCSGMAHALACEIGAEFDSVGVGRWKGNLPNETVWKRVKRLVTHDIRGQEIKSHALDAVGIGLSSIFNTDMRDPALWGRKQ